MQKKGKFTYQKLKIENENNNNLWVIKQGKKENNNLNRNNQMKLILLKVCWFDNFIHFLFV